MNKTRLFLLLLSTCLLLCCINSCHAVKTPSYMTTDTTSEVYTGSLMRYSAAVGDTAYFVVYPGEMLMTFSQNTMTVSLLCLEDGCDHADSTFCRAPIVSSLTTDGNALYLKCAGESFCRYMPGDSAVIELFSEQDVSGQMTSPISMTDGWLYYAVKYVEDSPNFGRAAFYKRSLAGDVAERVCLLDNVSAYSCLAVCGDTLYYTEDQTLKNTDGNALTGGTYFVGGLPTWKSPVFYADGTLMTYDGNETSSLIDDTVCGDILYRDGLVYALSADRGVLYTVSDSGTVQSRELSLPGTCQLICVFDDGCLVRSADTGDYSYCTYDTGECRKVVSTVNTASDPFAPFS